VVGFVDEGQAAGTAEGDIVGRTDGPAAHETVEVQAFRARPRVKSATGQGASHSCARHDRSHDSRSVTLRQRSAPDGDQREAFVVAHDHVETRPQPLDHVGFEEQRFGLGDPVKTELKNGPLHIFSAEHFFAASHALLMEQRPDLVGEYGAMVAIPTRHTFLVCPVNTFDIVHDIGMLLNVARKAEADGPGSITDQLYFFRDGKFSRLVSSLEGGQMKMTVPPEFQRVLEELQPEPEE
jgi:hypothetical protein